MGKDKSLVPHIRCDSQVFMTYQLKRPQMKKLNEHFEKCGAAKFVLLKNKHVYNSVINSFTTNLVI